MISGHHHELGLSVRLRIIRNMLGAAITFLGAITGVVGTSAAQTPAANIDEALQNITTLVRDRQIGYATFWDGNKFIQCRRLAAGDMRCEAAGTMMQPSLKSVLTPKALSRLTELGWSLNPSFGNHVRDFAANTPTVRIANHILNVLTEVYAANPADLALNTRWVADVTCPPRAGFSQNLAGSVNDAASMQSAATRGCSYVPRSVEVEANSNARQLIVTYGARTASEIQRLRLNSTNRVWVVFQAGIGYIQCAPDSRKAEIYCEAQSAESWPALTAILSSDRIKKLKSAGYIAPGHAPNYSKIYDVAIFNDAAIAAEILTILHDVYGYTGAPKLEFKTEGR